jgi:4-amino-4-deoxy-L-arabinose transferase-like glycosyltransferase
MPASIADEPTSVPPLQTPARTTWGLWLIALLFIASRLPSMLREPGREDEDVYAVPGWTILHTGVPSVPHLPSRNLKSPYYRADEIAFLEPPLFFYAQAAFFAVLPVEYWSARLPAAVSGALLLVMMGRLALRAGATPSAACWAAGLFALSRWLYFSATHARPDALCSAFGFAALLAVESWTRSRQSRWLVAGGVAIGLGGLTHPFALAYAIQAAFWTFASARGRQRVTAPLTLALVAMATASTWLALILQNVSAFGIQFENQFVHTRGGSLLTRLLWPWPAIMYHANGLFGHVSPWQFLLAAFGSAACIVCGKIENRPLLATIGWLAVSGAFLICGLVGTHHPVFGYFTYPSALAFIGVGWSVDRAVRRLAAAGPAGRGLAVALAAAVVVSFLFGSKIRVISEYVRHWNDINFNAPRFAASLIERLPPDATYVVDEEFVLDFLTAGRKTLAFRALVEDALPLTTPYDYRIRSRSTDRYFKDLTWDDQLLWTAGDPSNPYGCYAMVFQKNPPTSTIAPAARGAR